MAERGGSQSSGQKAMGQKPLVDSPAAILQTSLKSSSSSSMAETGPKRPTPARVVTLPPPRKGEEEGGEGDGQDDYFSQSQAGTSSSTPSGRATGPASSPPRPLFNRLSTLPNERILNHPDTKNRPRQQWTLPAAAKGKSPRAATLFLGRDYERWQIHDRDSMGLGMLKMAMGKRHGSSSALPESHDEYSGEDDGESALSDVFTDDESVSSGVLSRRSSRSSRSRSSSGIWKRPGAANLQPFTSATSTTPSSTDERTSRQGSITSATDSSGGGGTYPRPRRFSSNGPEAAFLRHETVIGIHTPRNGEATMASHMARPSLSAGMERVTLAPLSQVKRKSSASSSLLPSGAASKLDSSPAVGSPASVSKASVSKASPDLRKTEQDMSSSNLLKKAAAAAAAAAVAAGSSSAETSTNNSPVPASPISSVSPSSTVAVPRPKWASRSPSPARPLKLARRRKPIRVEGTLYDRTGPFREGAVTDGLSVRLFSAERSEEQSGFADSDEEDVGKSNSKLKSASGKPRSSRRRRRDESASRKADGADDEEADEQAPSEGIPQVPDASSATTYLITTPDNRVSSAAKLRRWAMDGSGKFYAAMEIKSVEAKLRGAMDVSNPSGAPGGAGNGGASSAWTKSLAKILRQTYLDDILNEIQKAETLNPDRINIVSSLLLTEDGKYVRLEEDYPEEAFFVVAGCEDSELYPVVALVFIETLRHIHRFHMSGWMHGDIKLENLMFDIKGDLVVIDYENANPYRVPGGDGCVSLMSFDWIPPEANYSGTEGRRAGPAADLWALGANLVRAFALRDGIDDAHVREWLLESGQSEFFRFRKSLIKVDESKVKATAKDVDLRPILAGVGDDDDYAGGAQEATSGSNGHSNGHQAASGTSTPARTSALPSLPRLFHLFALSCPSLLSYLLASTLTPNPTSRSIESELEGLDLATELEREHDGRTMRVAREAVKTAIGLSGSEWVRPKLEEARCSLGLGGGYAHGQGGDQEEEEEDG